MIRPNIRWATSQDQPALIEIAHRTGTGEEHIMQEKMEDMLLDPVLVAEVEGKIVGFMFWVHGNRHAYIDTLAVLPEYQNHGIGLFLLSEVTRILKGLGILNVYACTRINEGKPVRDMLCRLGYTPLGEVFALSKRLSLEKVEVA